MKIAREKFHELPIFSRVILHRKYIRVLLRKVRNDKYLTMISFLWN